MFQVESYTFLVGTLWGARGVAVPFAEYPRFKRVTGHLLPNAAEIMQKTDHFIPRQLQDNKPVLWLC